MSAIDILIFGLYGFSLLCVLLSVPIRWLQRRSDPTLRHLRLSFAVLGAGCAFWLLARLARLAFE
jgi:hypothetical protein